MLLPKPDMDTAAVVEVVSIRYQLRNITLTVQQRNDAIQQMLKNGNTMLDSESNSGSRPLSNFWNVSVRDRKVKH